MNKHKWWHKIINLWGTTTTISGNEKLGALKHTELCFCGEVLGEFISGGYYLHTHIAGQDPKNINCKHCKY